MLATLARSTARACLRSRVAPVHRLAPRGATTSEQLHALRSGLDEVVGHEDAKEALILALISHEHVYLEGPPGVAKTMLAELAASLSSLQLYSYQMHRDTRLSELIGDSIVVREADQGKGEVIRHAVRPGGILTSEVCVLDDISRAPGEALNVLLRVLNERCFRQQPIPLLTAIATANPALENYYVEPLDPANLDRFTFQLQVPGLLEGCDWENARQVIRKCQHRKKMGSAISLTDLRDALLAGHEALWEVAVSDAVAEQLLRVVQQLKKQPEVTQRNTILSDRTFLVKAIKVMRAKAVLEGRRKCEPSDLLCLRLLTTFRVPPEVHARLPAIIKDILNVFEPDSNDGNNGADGDSMPPQVDGAAGTDAQSGEQDCARGDSEDDAGPDDASPSTKAHDGQAMPDWWQGETGGSSGYDDESVPKDRHETAKLGDCGQDGFIEPVTPLYSSPVEDFEHHKQLEQAHHVANVDVLLQTLQGSVERGVAKQALHPGGPGRVLAPLRGLEDFDDAEAPEWVGWLDGHSFWPQGHSRRRHRLGGQVVLCKDTSSSMEGWRAQWASSLTEQLVALAKKRHMRLGYLEFSCSVRAHFDPAGSFLSSNYDHLAALAKRRTCSGSTDYAAALRAAMMAWDGHPKHLGNRHILFVTDGVPTVGDPFVTKEMRQARQLGVQIHTVYVGCPWTYPWSLHTMASETQGAHFSAFADPDLGTESGAQAGRIQVALRHSSEWYAPEETIGRGTLLSCLPSAELSERRAHYFTVQRSPNRFEAYSATDSSPTQPRM